MEKDNKYIIPMVDRAFEIINLMYDSNGTLGVSEISKKLELPKATVYRILHTLGKWDFVEKDWIYVNTLDKNLGFIVNLRHT